MLSLIILLLLLGGAQPHLPAPGTRGDKNTHPRARREGPSTAHGTGQGPGVARGPGRGEGPWGGPGGSRRCSPVLGSSPAVGESKVVAGGHFGIFPQPAGHCGGGDRGAAAAGAMTGGPARGGGGERTGHTEGQGRERARERRVRLGASRPTPARRPLPKHGRAEHRYSP